MIQIRPVSDLSNKFPEIEDIVNNGQPVFLTKNGYGTMVVMSLEQYSSLTDSNDYIERVLDEADKAALEDPTRYTHEEVFGRIRGELRGEI